MHFKNNKKRIQAHKYKKYYNKKKGSCFIGEPWLIGSRDLGELCL